MLKKATQRLAGALPAQARGMGHAAGPRITARSERYETLWGMEHGPDKAFSAKEADLWKKFTFVAVPIACALGLFDLVSHMTHPHHEVEKIDAPYLRIRNKQFPWGDNNLFGKPQ